MFYLTKMILRVFLLFPVKTNANISVQTVTNSTEDIDLIQLKGKYEKIINRHLPKFRSMTWSIKFNFNAIKKV